MNKLVIAVLFGGCSEEHDISIKSASEIAANLDLDKYEPLYIGISKNGNWKMCEFPCLSWEQGKCKQIMLSPDKQTHGMLILEDDGKYYSKRIDVIFPVIHGKTGEDGTIQGLFELSGIPYVGCDIQSSVLCMDKSLAHMVVKKAGIMTPDFNVYSYGELPDDEEISYPVFVKPARSGSSFGVSKVSCKEKLIDAVISAYKYDTKVLVEEAITGIEVGCAVLENSETLITGEIDEICISQGFFRIHQEKNPESGSSNSQVIVPARISESTKEAIQNTAKRIYHALGCKGLSRIDMFLTSNEQIIFNEVNTLPGFTTYSRYPRMMNAVNINISDIINTLVSFTLRK